MSPAQSASVLKREKQNRKNESESFTLAASGGLTARLRTFDCGIGVKILGGFQM